MLEPSLSKRCYLVWIFRACFETSQTQVWNDVVKKKKKKKVKKKIKKKKKGKWRSHILKKITFCFRKSGISLSRTLKYKFNVHEMCTAFCHSFGVQVYWPHFLLVFLFCCTGRGLAKARSLVQGVPPAVYKHDSHRQKTEDLRLLAPQAWRCKH